MDHSTNISLPEEISESSLWVFPWKGNYWTFFFRFSDWGLPWTNIFVWQSNINVYPSPLSQYGHMLVTLLYFQQGEYRKLWTIWCFVRMVSRGWMIRSCLSEGLLDVIYQNKKQFWIFIAWSTILSNPQYWKFSILSDPSESLPSVVNIEDIAMWSFFSPKLFNKVKQMHANVCLKMCLKKHSKTTMLLFWWLVVKKVAVKLSKIFQSLKLDFWSCNLTYPNLLQANK